MRICFIRITWVLLVMGMVSFLAGCSHSRTGGQPSLEFWCYSGGGSKDQTGRFWETVAQGFEKANPGVRVRVVTDIPHTYYMSMLGTRFIGRNPPDVMLMDDVDIGDLAREKLLMPLEDFVKSDPDYRSEDYAPSMVKDSFVGGVRYSIPWYGSFVQLTYREDLFDRAGVRPPRTWKELVTVCRTLREKAGLQHPFAMDLTGSFWMINWMWQNGGNVLSPDSKQVTIDTPECIEAVRFVHDLIYLQRAMDPALAGGAKMQDMWSTGRIAIMMDGAFSVGRYDTLYPQWKGKWAIAPLPAGRYDISFYGGAHLVMSRITRHPDLAWRFMAYATSAENELTFSDMLGHPPGNMKVFDLPEFRQKHSHLAKMQPTIAKGRNNPLAPFFSKIWYDIFRNKVMDAIMHDPDADIPTVMRSAAAEMQKIADDYWARHQNE